MGGEIGIMCMALQSAEGLIFVVSNHCQTVSPILQCSVEFVRFANRTGHPIS